MADEKKINDEVMSDDELEGVAGGAGEPYGGIDTDPAANQLGAAKIWPRIR
ncbi:MAG: hypothetical protein J5809_07985 [Selenomonadaceae bacterium]|nr:hypothetical protein [Selenomonadaceae bacterium]